MTTVKEKTGEIRSGVRNTSSHFPWKKLAQWSLLGLLVIGALAMAIWAAKKFTRPIPPSVAKLTIQVYGLVPGAKETPLADAHVLVDGREIDGQGKSTDRRGQLILFNLAQKQVTLQISRLGYEPVEAAIIELNVPQKSEKFTLKLKEPDGMTFIQGGEFLMGRDNGPPEERPAYTAPIKSFFIDRTEVTNKQYKKFVDENPNRTPPTWINGSFAAGEENFPVTDVTWDAADAYAKWAKKRLPTEEEWEYAARGKKGRDYPWEGATYSPNRANLFTGNLKDVGQYPDGATPDRLLDMLGNVWEWTSSDFQAYPGGTVNIPKNFQGLILKVMRGGGYKTPKGTSITASYRGWYPATRNDWPQGTPLAEKNYSATGFRCVKELEP